MLRSNVDSYVSDVEFPCLVSCAWSCMSWSSVVAEAIRKSTTNFLPSPDICIPLTTMRALSQMYHIGCVKSVILSWEEPHCRSHQHDGRACTSSSRYAWRDRLECHPAHASAPAWRLGEPRATRAGSKFSRLTCVVGTCPAGVAAS